MRNSKELAKLIKENIELIGIKGTLIRGVDWLSSYFCEDEMIYRHAKRICFKEMQNMEYEERESFLSNYIWVCWFQGIENAPKAIQLCYKNIKKHTPGHDVVLITDENYMNYVDLPGYITDKYKKGLIQKAHFSDILRTALLCKWGGVWIDATMLLTDNIPEWIYSEDLFFFKYFYNKKTSQVGSSQFLAAKSHNEVLERLLHGLYIYHKRKKKVASYYIYHYIMALATQCNERTKKIYESIPRIDPFNNHILQFELFDPFNEKRWEYIKQMSFVHKLSRHRLTEDNIKNKGSFYDYLFNDTLDNGE